MKVRHHLALLVLAGVLPPLFFVMFMLGSFGEKQRAESENRLRQTTLAFRVAVDTGIDSPISVLTALATSDHLDSGDLRSFFDEARRVLAAQALWQAIFLTDERGQVVVATTQPSGTLLPSVADRSYIQHVLKSGEPSVSGFLQSRITGRPAASVVVPVLREGILKYSVGALYDLELLTSLLQRQRVPPGWAGMIVDQEGIILAGTRTRDLIGQPAAPVLVERTSESAEGPVKIVTTKDGMRAYLAFSRSPRFGWTVVFEEPADILEASTRRSWWTITGAAIGSIAVGIGLATLVGGRLTRLATGLTRAAEALGRGEEVRSPTSRVEEIATIGRAIEQAAVKRARVEAQLRESEVQYRSLFEHSLDAILLSAPTGQMVRANPAAERLFGLSEAEICARGRDGVMDLTDARLARAREQRAQTGEFRGELNYRRADGSVFPAEITSTMFRGPDGAEKISTVIRDVTERKRAEEALRRAEAVTSSLVEHAPLGIYRSTADGTLLAANSALVTMLGYESAAELLTRNLTTDVYQDPAERARAIASRRAGRVRELEMGWRRKDGTPITVRTSGRVLADDTFEVFVEDVTEQRQTEEQLRQAQKLEAIGLLAGGVAHDFNNLLAVILGWSHLLLKKLPGADPTRQKIEVIARAAERAAGVTRQLLALSRKQITQPQVIDLGATVAGLEPFLRRLIREDIELVLVRGAHLGSVRADPIQVEQIIMNLVVNARDAMPRGGGLTIEVANADLDQAFATSHPGAQPGRYVRLTVQDTGTGIDPATRARIFEPFFTTKAPGVGTGLGLASVSRIVEQSQGHIVVDSAPGQGARFDIFLPQVDAVAAERVPSAASAIPRGTETILIVEDEAGLRELAKEVLEEQGYTVLEARDGEDAVRLGDQHTGPIQLILTDVVMPRMSGLEVATQVTARHPEMRVLFMTGYAEESMVRYGSAETRSAVLMKPFSPDVLVRKVREVLG